MGRVESTSAHFSCAGRLDRAPGYLLRRVPGRFVFSRASLVMSFVVAAAVAIAPLVSVEVFGGTMPPVTRSVAMMRIFTVVAVVRSVAIVDVAMEVFRAVKPWAGSDKDAIGEPLGAVITVGSTTV